MPADIPACANAVLQFWFGTLDAAGFAAPDRNRFWFMPTGEDDAAIRRQFGAPIAAAVGGEYADWRAHPESALALIILCDQMTRSVWRGDARAFGGDAVALAACREGLAKNAFRALPPAYQMFCFMPLEHSENIADQTLCVTLFQSLQRQYANAENDLQSAVDYAVLHRDIIAKFGRFPHRNAILNRPSTDNERLYLQTNKENFGQSAPPANAGVA